MGLWLPWKNHTVFLPQIPISLEEGPPPSILGLQGGGLPGASPPHLFVCCLIGPHPPHMEVPRLGVELEHRCQPTPQSQLHGIQAASATYTTAHSNAGSLTH